MSTEQETLTVDDLPRVFIRVQFSHTKFGNLNCAECTDKQFDTWAKSRIEIQGEDMPWSLEERAKFCNMLYQAGALHILKKDIELEDEA